LTNEQQIVWLAGLLEGEGCFSWRKVSRKKRSFRCQVRLSMTDEDIVGRAASIMGAKTVWSYQHPGRKNLFTAVIDGEVAASVMRQVLPFMGQRRSAKIEEVLTLFANRLTHAQAIIKRDAARRINKRCPRTADLFVVKESA
jgi:hypothetical protein